MIQTAGELQRRAKYHLTRRAGRRIPFPGREVVFLAHDGGSAHTGEFWAFAPRGLWLVCAEHYVHVRKATERDQHCPPGIEWIETKENRDG